MKILNHLNTSFIISKIKYPFIKIASLFQRISVANRIQIIENPKYLSTADTLRSSKNSNSSTKEVSISDLGIEQNQYEDIDKYNTVILVQANDNSEHFYTTINKTGNGKIDRYLPSEQISLNKENTKITEYKNGLPHPFLKENESEIEIVPPPILPKNRLLIQEIIKRDASYIKFPRGLKEMPLTILKGSELFI